MNDKPLTVRDFLESMEESARDMGNVHDHSWLDRIRNWLGRLLNVLARHGIPEPPPKPLGPLPQRIHGRKFLEHLGDLGVIRKADLERGMASDYVRRVVIDASIDGPVKLYVERYGDDRLLDLVWTDEGMTYRETHR
jgi:hypothetical protein